MKTIRQLVTRSWRPLVSVVCLALLAYLLYFHQLSTLLPGYHSAELQTVRSASDWHTILQNPVDGPYKGLVWLATAVLHHGAVAARAISAGCAIVAVTLFFLIVRQWFSFRIAFFGAAIFATSAGLLHSARLGTPQITEMASLAFLAALLWYREQREHRIAIGYLVVLLCAVLCYIPGLLWFELLGFGLLFRNVRRNMRQTSSLHIAGYSLLFLATLAPLLAAGAHHVQVLLAAAAIPSDTHQLSHFGVNLWHGLEAIGLRSDGNPLLWVGHTPLLNIIELTLFILGLYHYVYQERSVRTLYMIGAILISLLLVGCNGTLGFAALIPFVYLFVVSGVYRLLQHWFTVFPRNPFARFTGVALIAAMLFFSVLYQTRNYFVAWPHNHVVRSAFSHQQN